MASSTSGGSTAGVERLMHRPIFGGVFGRGRFALASMPCVSRGLHSIRYMVVEPQAGAVLSIAEDKVEALAGARRILAATSELAAVPVEEPAPEQLEIWPMGEPERQPEAPRHIPRRRKEVFDKCGGKCHYCGEVLTLDGKWHIEHMMPRALGGGDDPLNLVAACVPCNLQKSDRTALEFVSKLGA
jgi:hypothetical protein